MKERASSGIGGFTANSLVIPLTIAIAILHIFIISLVYKANRANAELSDMLQNCSEYQQSATNLQAGASTLSETATAFVQMPVGADGAFNAGQLLPYAQELSRDRRGPEIAAWFRSRAVSEEIKSCIDTAAADSERMREVQLHAIALLCSVYPRPPIEMLSTIPEVPLTEEELAMTEEERIEYARSLILSKDYSQLKASISENIETCHRIVQQVYSSASAECERHIASLRTWLWIDIFVIIFLLLVTFVLFYRWLILPLRRYAKQITSDQPMDQTSGIREMRLLVHAYNTLLRRHDKLESILRSAAETDALTDLPNRYSLEHFVLEEGGDGGAMAVLLFDVNFLKRANDTGGHMMGDRLLRTAAACIRECFGTDDAGRCFRIGGDEFAAVLRGCSEEEVRRRIERFSFTTEREGISVSVGYAYSEKTDEDSFDRLMKTADERMYVHKKRIHELDHAVGRT